MNLRHHHPPDSWALILRGTWLSLLLLLLNTGCTITPHTTPFVIGLYGVDDTNTFREIRNLGVDIITGSSEVRFLDAAHRHGLRVFASLGTTAGLDFDPVQARRSILHADRHPALWAWYLIDEPDLNEIHPGLVEAASRFVKSTGSRKPVGVVLQHGGEALNYARAADLLMIDRYPVAWQPLCVFENHVRLSRLGTAAGRPLYGIVQAFDWTYYKNLVPDETALRPPTEQEMRCMSYGALVQGANGLFYFTFNSPPWDIRKHPETWSALKSVLTELNTRRGLFGAEHLWWPWKRSLVFQDPVRLNEVQESRVSLAWLRVGPGSRDVAPGEYVLALNNSGAPANVRIHLPRRVTGTLPLLEGNESRTVEENWLRESFEPYGVRVYGPLPTSTASVR